MSDTPLLHLVALTSELGDITAAASAPADTSADHALDNDVSQTSTDAPASIQAVVITEEAETGSTMKAALAIPLSSSSPRFPLRVRGYDRHAVDAALLADERTRVDLETRSLEHAHHVEALTKQLATARQELRYWHDRQAFIDGEIERARASAEKIIAEAGERASTLEQQAQERTLKMIDRVCTEANEVMRHAREESAAVAQRYRDDVASAKLRLSNMSGVQRDVVLAMRAAMTRFEDGMSELELVTPSALAAVGAYGSEGTVEHMAEVAVQPANNLAAAATVVASPAAAPSTLTTTLDTRDHVTLGQSAAARVISAKMSSTMGAAIAVPEAPAAAHPAPIDPALETLRLMIEGAPAR